MQKILSFAGAHERFLAHMIDSVAIYFASSLLMTLMQGGEAAAMLIPFVFGGFYFSYFQAGRYQASPGMRIVGIYLLQLNGRNVTQRDALSRYLAFMMPMYPLYVSVFSDRTQITLFLWLAVVWYATIMFRPDRAGMHDIMCHMRVVRGKTDMGKY